MKTLALPVREGPVRLGAKLRAARKMRGLSLEQVATAIGVNKSYVSKLEHDSVSPSIATLVRYCDAVGTAIGNLFSQPTANLIRKDERKPTAFGGAGLSEFVISGEGQKDILVLSSEILPGGGSGEELYTLRSSVDLVHVVSGRLTIVLDDVTYELYEGDTLTFAPSVPHSWHNPSATESVKTIWVIAPPP